MCDRPRDGRGGHHEHVRLGFALLEHRPLDHAKPMLLVDHDEPETLECGAAAHQRLRADDDLRLTGRNPLECFPALRLRLAANEQFETDSRAG